MPGKFILKERLILVAVLPTGYGKSLVFQVLPRLLREREETRATTSGTKSVVLVVSPLNALMYDQISKLRARGVKAAVLGVKNGINTDSPVISQWEGACESITQAGYKIVFCHPEAFLSCTGSSTKQRLFVSRQSSHSR